MVSRSRRQGVRSTWLCNAIYTPSQGFGSTPLASSTRNLVLTDFSHSLFRRLAVLRHGPPLRLFRALNGPLFSIVSTHLLNKTLHLISVSWILKAIDLTSIGPFWSLYQVALVGAHLLILSLLFLFIWLGISTLFDGAHFANCGADVIWCHQSPYLTFKLPAGCLSWPR